MNPMGTNQNPAEAISASQNTDPEVLAAKADINEKEHPDAPEETSKGITPPSDPPVQDQQSSDEEKFIEWAGKINKVLAKGVQAIVEVGQQLIAAKHDVGSRNFQKMVKLKLPFCVRQAQKYEYSGAKRPPIPAQSGHRIRRKAARDSGAKRPGCPGCDAGGELLVGRG